MKINLRSSLRNAYRQISAGTAVNDQLMQRSHLNLESSGICWVQILAGIPVKRHRISAASDILVSDILAGNALFVA